MLFFTSDTHFGSNQIIIRENRPFKNYKNFKKYIIKLWNKQSKKDDIIYHLGDFINYNDKDQISWMKALSYVKKIKAKIILIIGNNEERIIDKTFKGDFQKFKDFCIGIGFFDVKKDDIIELKGQKFYLNHYPKKYKKGFTNLFGHTHRVTGLWKPFGINVGCDLNHFMLYSEKDVLKLVKQKNTYWDNDPNNFIY